MRGALVLEDGTVFGGEAFGRQVPHGCEVVCIDGATWPQLLAAPAYAGQIVVAVGGDAPATGTAGPRCYPKGLVLNGTASPPPDDVVWQLGLGGLKGVDTHGLALHLKRTGPLAGRMVVAGSGESEAGPAGAARFPVCSPCEVSTVRPYRIYGGGPRVVVYDFGVSPDLLAWLVAFDCHVTVVPWDYPAEDVTEMLPDAVILSGGPGNPAACDEVIGGFRPVIGRVPLVAIGLGHQLLARAQGGRTGQMWCGHRGRSVLVRELESGRVYETDQSHGYAVLGAPVGAKVTYVAVSDGSIEGLIYPGLDAVSLQFLPGPEAVAGPITHLWRRWLPRGSIQENIA